MAWTAVAYAALVKVGFEFYAMLEAQVERLFADAVVTATLIRCPEKVSILISENR